MEMLPGSTLASGSFQDDVLVIQPSGSAKETTTVTATTTVVATATTTTPPSISRYMQRVMNERDSDGDSDGDSDAASVSSESSESSESIADETTAFTAKQDEATAPIRVRFSVSATSLGPFSLLQSMKTHANIRNAFFNEEGRAQMNFPRSDQGWLVSLLILQGRALDWIVLPWCAVVIHCAIYIFFQEIVFDVKRRDLNYWNAFSGLAVNSTLSFLLVFRLNRAAGRYWLARTLWGDLVAHTRTFVGGVLVYGSHSPTLRDDVVRWMAVLPVFIMEYIRGPKDVPWSAVAGLITDVEVVRTRGHIHPPLFVCDQVRYNLRALFPISDSTSPSVAYGWASERESLESLLNKVMDCCGGMERIKSTPLPMVYVSHLRTFLLIALIMFPYVWGPYWRWGTIAVIAIAAFALLGIEGTAAEVERPFSENRVNALNMDLYCKTLLMTIQQQIESHENRLMDQKEIMLEV
jgi:ion channel-forming bestrophin family protein